MRTLLIITALSGCRDEVPPPALCHGVEDYFAAAEEDVRNAPARFIASTEGGSFDPEPGWESLFSGEVVLEAYACDHAGCWTAVEVNGVAQGLIVREFHALFEEHRWCPATDTRPLRFEGWIEVERRRNVRVSLEAVSSNELVGTVTEIPDGCTLSDGCLETPVGEIRLARR